MATKYRVVANFHVDVAGEGDAPVRRQAYQRGQTVAIDEIPDGHTAEAWIAAGLVVEATAAVVVAEEEPAAA